MRTFAGRFPHRSDMIAVLGVAVFLCFTWTIIGFLNKLSSFILYFSPGTIGGIFAYMMAFALLESLAVTGFVVLLSAVLPAHWLKEGFAVKGFLALVVVGTASILVQNSLADRLPSIFLLLAGSAGILVLIALLIAVVRAVPKVQNILLNVQDRLLIMLFVYVPIGFISLLVVLYRNLL